MTIEELFALAKKDIFGDIPDCRLAKIGYSMARMYYDKLIEEAEAISQGAMIPYLGFSVSVEKACRFAQEPDLDAFPDEIRIYLEECSIRFAERYGHLGVKAA